MNIFKLMWNRVRRVPVTTPLQAWQRARQDICDYIASGKSLLYGDLDGMNGTHCAFGVWRSHDYALSNRYDGIGKDMENVIRVNDNHGTLMYDTAAREQRVIAWIDAHIEALS